METSKKSLESRWQGLVFVLEKPEFSKTISKNKLTWILPLVCFGLFGLILNQFQFTFLANLFLFLPIVGLLFSIAALKDLFGAKSEFFNKFCTMTISTNCNAVVSSNKWKIFELINFSDLSIVFFSSQIFGLLLSVLIEDQTSFFSIQKILLFCSIPIIVLSLYFQKFIEKSWCPICLVITSIILIELLFLIIYFGEELSISTKSLVLIVFTYLFISSIWFNLKNVLNQNKNLKESQLISNRFQRNYTIFRNTLFSTQKIEIPSSHLIVGNREARLEISIVTHPFCSFCEFAHEVLEKILEKHQNDLRVKIIFRTDIRNEEKKAKLLFRNLMDIYRINGEMSFMMALKDWFKNKNIDNWLQLNQINNNPAIDDILIKQYDWCINNDINFTPAIFINGYQYPKGYDRKYLEYFILELLDDNKFSN